MPASATSRSTRRRARSISSSGTPDANRLAARRDVWRLVAGQDLREPVDERRAIDVVAPRGQLGLEDLGAALHQPPQQRQVLALGEALVAAIAQILERAGRRGPRGRRRRGYGRCGGWPGVRAQASYGCERPSTRPSTRSADAQQGRVRVDGGAAAGVVLEVQVIHRSSPVLPT